MKTFIFLLFSFCAFGQGWTPVGTSWQSTQTDAGGCTHGCTDANYAFNSQAPNLYNAWNGAFYDTKRDRMCTLAAGGDGDYYGNEMICLAMSTLTTSEIVPHSAFNYTVTTSSTELTSDNQLTPRHNYGCQTYIPSIDKVWQYAGFLSPSDSGSNAVYLSDPVTGVPVLKSSPTSWISSGPSDGPRCGFAPWLGTQGSMIVLGGTTYYLLRYDIATDTWSLLNSANFRTCGPGGSFVNIGSNFAVDPIRQAGWMFGGSDLGTAGCTANITYVDLSGNDPTYSAVDDTPNWTGCTSLIGNNWPGMAFDYALGKFVGYPGTGGTVYIIDPTTKTCVSQTYSGGPTANAGARGAFTRWQYSPKYQVFIACMDSTAQCQTLSLGATVTSGQGASTLSCIDRDGDHYGTGPDALGPFTDLVIDATTNTLVSSASHSFTSADLYRVINITGGSGFTVMFNNQIVSVSGGKATLLFAAGTVGSTGGHWEIDGCLGPDADDSDASVQTESQLATKWGSLALGLNHLGYAPANIWYTSPTGNDGTGAVNNVALPFATCCGSGKANPAPGDMVLMRGGVYPVSSAWQVPTGSAGLPVTFMSYPGELAQFNVNGGLGFTSTFPSYVVVDGIRLVKTLSTGGDGCISAGTNAHMRFSHIDSSGCEWGLIAFQISDFFIEDSIFHDNLNAGCGTDQHGIYIGNHNPASPAFALIVRRNLLYSNCRNGLQVNGVSSNVLVEQNVVYGNGTGGIAFLSGVKNSVVRSNTSFDNAQTGFNLFNYPAFCGAYDPTKIGTACPYDQSNNLVENNTLYSTGEDPTTPTASTGSAAIAVTNEAGYILSSTSYTLGTGSKTFTLESYSSGKTYGTNDVVIYSGSFYVSVDDSNIGNQPDISPSEWTVMGTTASLGTQFWPNSSIIEICPYPGGNNDAPCDYTYSAWGEGTVTGSTSTTVTINITTVVGSATGTAWQINFRRLGDLGHNTYLNNILVTYSAGVSGNGYPNFRYDENVYTTTSTYQNNVFYSLSPTAGTHTNVIQIAAAGTTTYYVCAAMVAASGGQFGLASNCTNADPMFTSASPNFWNTPVSFNFIPAAGSPALGAGTTVTIPPYDVVGKVVPLTSPSLGAFQTAGSAGSGGSTFGGSGKIGGSSVVH